MTRLKSENTRLNMHRHKQRRLSGNTTSHTSHTSITSTKGHHDSNNKNKNSNKKCGCFGTNNTTSTTTLLFFSSLVLFLCISLILNVYIHRSDSKERSEYDGPLHAALDSFWSSSTLTNSSRYQNQSQQQQQNQYQNQQQNQHQNQQQHQHQQQLKLGELSCAKYGGPSDEIASKMVYWKDIPSDASFQSPHKLQHSQPVQNVHETKYMTFEPDGGGWNNIRMAMETVVVLAHATGRTLVLPPAQSIYLLRRDAHKHNTKFTFADFFPIESLNDEHHGIDIITMEEFLQRMAMTGRLRNHTTGHISFPPQRNRTDWNGGNAQDMIDLKTYLRQVTHTPIWRRQDCIAAFPSTVGSDNNDNNIQALHQTLESITSSSSTYLPAHMKSAPPVNGSLHDRMNEMLSGRTELCIYNQTMQEQPVLHFMCYPKVKMRLLTHFYTFIFFQNWKHQTWAARFVRDHLRYNDELQCAAARIVHAIEQRSRNYASTITNTNTSTSTSQATGEFDTLHVRRGDFQFKSTRVDAEQLFHAIQDKIPNKSTIYIATDERDKRFFDIFHQQYDICFLDDFLHLIPEINTNHLGMIDQLVASRGRTFFGTYFSTFTGYINRLRGYRTDAFHLEGWENGALKSYYFLPNDKKFAMRKYSPVRDTFSREFPIAWRDIDNGVFDLN